MMIISTHSEEILLNLLNGTDETSHKRVIHISKLLEAQRKKVESILNELLDEIAPGEVDALFCCEDGDMFLVAQGISVRAFETLKKRLEVSVHISNLTKHMELYELGHHHRLLTEMVDRKLENKTHRVAEEKEAQEAELQEKMRSKALANVLDNKLKDTIKSRRATRKNKEILVVEDDVFTRRLVSETLRGHCTVSEAENGNIALKTYINQAPNMVFLDINMPDLNGHEILHTILEMDPDAFVIMFSGCSDSVNVMRAMRDGAKGFISKPFRKDKLMQYIELCPTGT